MTSFDFVSPTSWFTSASASDKRSLPEDRGDQSCRRCHAIPARIGPHAAKLYAGTRCRIRGLVSLSCLHSHQACTEGRESAAWPVARYSCSWLHFWFEDARGLGVCSTLCPRIRTYLLVTDGVVKTKKAESLPQTEPSTPAPGEDLEK